MLNSMALKKLYYFLSTFSQLLCLLGDPEEGADDRKELLLTFIAEIKPVSAINLVALSPFKNNFLGLTSARYVRPSF